VTGPYDPEQRRAAARMEHANPHWVITWGPGSRRYWAFGRFSTPGGMVVSAPSPQELLAAMRQAELAARPSRLPPARPPETQNPPPAQRQRQPRHPGNPPPPA